VLQPAMNVCGFLRTEPEGNHHQKGAEYLPQCLLPEDMGDIDQTADAYLRQAAHILLAVQP